jgi:hypothetical protein
MRGIEELQGFGFLELLIVMLNVLVKVGLDLDQLMN